MADHRTTHHSGSAFHQLCAVSPRKDVFLVYLWIRSKTLWDSEPISKNICKTLGNCLDFCLTCSPPAAAPVIRPQVPPTCRWRMHGHNLYWKQLNNFSFWKVWSPISFLVEAQVFQVFQEMFAIKVAGQAWFFTSYGNWKNPKSQSWGSPSFLILLGHPDRSPQGNRDPKGQHRRQQTTSRTKGAPSDQAQGLTRPLPGRFIAFWLFFCCFLVFSSSFNSKAPLILGSDIVPSWFSTQKSRPEPFQGFSHAEWWYEYHNFQPSIAGTASQSPRLTIRPTPKRLKA